MSFGTLYVFNPNPRSTVCRAIARANKLDIKIVYADHEDVEGRKELLKVNPLGQVPTFVGPDGWVLSECIPITLHFTAQDDTTTLLGGTRREYLEIHKWMSFVNMDFLPSVGGIILPLIGRNQVIRKNTEDCLAAFHRHCKLTDDHLKNNKFLIGERITVADYFAVSLLTGVFKVFHKMAHKTYPNMSRWFYESYNMPLWKDEAGELEYVDLDGVSELMERGEDAPAAPQEAPTQEQKIEVRPAATTAVQG